MTDWEIHGMEFVNCNCAYGCPCQFNALPTHGHCRAIIFQRIDKGFFGETELDGTRMGFAVMWPGPIHKGGGHMQPVIDKSANAAQRHALFSIMTGKETDPMMTFFAIYSAMCEKIAEPLYTDISIDIDMNARRATCKASGFSEGRGEPILNPVTGKEHRAGIFLPNGFEYGRNECGRGWSKSTGRVAMELGDSYAHWCELHLNRHGRIKQPWELAAAG
ncbi:MAG: DUF1326 domain-containing protein [Solimonas sp.]